MSTNHVLAWDKGHSKGSTTAANGGAGEMDAVAAGEELRFS